MMMTVCVFLSQGEVGEPGQKGSKADKGEQVRCGKLIKEPVMLKHLLLSSVI